MEIQHIPRVLKANNSIQKPAAFKNCLRAHRPGGTGHIIESFNLSIHTFLSKNIFHFQLNSEGKILVLLKSVHALPLIFTDRFLLLFFFFLCLGLHKGHWNGLSWFATAQRSKRGAIRVRDSEDEKASAWSAWPPSNFIQFHVLSPKHWAAMRQQVYCDCQLECTA